MTKCITCGCTVKMGPRCHSCAMKLRWQNTESRKKLLISLGVDPLQKAISDDEKELAKVTSSERRSLAQKRRFARPEEREKASRQAKERWAKGCYGDPEELSEKRSAITKKRWAEGKYDGVFDGIFQSPEIRKKRSDTAKNLWANGTYDGVFCSPTSIELAVEQGLSNLGFDYISQYRPEGYNRVYDIYIPGHEILIETHGDYWHDYNTFPEKEMVDKEKQIWALEHGNFFIALWEYEINSSDINELILNRLPIHLQEVYIDQAL